MREGGIQQIIDSGFNIKSYKYRSIEDLNSFLLSCIKYSISNEIDLSINLRDDISVIPSALEKVSSLDINNEKVIAVTSTQTPSLDYELYSQLIELINANDRLYAKVLGDWTVVDIIKVLCEAREEIVPYPFVITNLDYTYSPSEFYDLNHAISKYISFNRYQNQDGLKARILSTYNAHTILNSDQGQLNSKVRSWFNWLNEIKKNLLIGLHDIAKADTSSNQLAYHSQKKELEGTLTKLNCYIDLYGTDIVDKPSLLTLNSQIKTRYKQWSDLSSHYTLINGSNPAQSVSFIENELLQLQSLYTSNQKIANQRLKSINELNTQNSTIKESSKELQKLISEINSTQLFLEEQECNAVSIVKKIAFIDQLKYKIEIFLQCNNIQATIEWYTQLENLSPGFTSFLEQLKSCNIDEWRYQFEYHYLSSLIESLNIGLLNPNEVDLGQLIIGIESLENQLSSRMIAQYNNQLEAKVEDLKSTNKSLYKSIKSGKATPRELIDSLPHQSWIYINENIDSSKTQDEEDISPIVKVTLTSQGNTSAINVIYIEESDEYACQPIPNNIEINQKLSDTNISQQLNIAKGLAYNIFPYLHIVRAYQTKLGNIISLLEGHWQEDLFDYLHPRGSKEFTIETPDHLTDFILSTDRPLYLITQDGLINAKENSTVDQLMVLAQCQKAGLNIHNISSIDLLNLGPLPIHLLLSDIGFETKDDSPSPTSSTIA